MKSPPPLIDEESRLRALRESGILDTPPEEKFDDVVKLAASICNAPIALLGLADRSRIWFKAKVGVEINELREDSLSMLAMRGTEPLIVSDATQDPRFAGHALITSEPYLRFWAGAPIRTEAGHGLGTLCVIDRRSRTLGLDQIQMLEILARQVGAQIELRRHARELERARRELDDFLDTANDLIQIVGTDGHLRYVNEAWKRALGYRGDALERLSSLDVVAPEHQNDARVMFQAVLAGEPIPRFLTTLVGKDQKRIVVEGSAHCSFEGGNPVAVRSILRDVTARVQWELERDRFFSVSTELMCVAGFDGRFKRLNQAWERVLGYPLAELQGRPFLDFVNIADHPATIAEFQSLLAGGRTISFENRYRAKDGTHRWLQWTAAPYAEEQLIYASARDVTERKEIDQMKTEFVATVSHELRTPLTSIRGSLGLLVGGVMGPLSDQALEMVRIAHSNSERLIRLINDILDLEKIEAGKLELNLLPVDCGVLVAAALGAVHGMAEQQGIELRSSKCAGYVVRGDEDRLIQVLTNLLSNAIKFSPPRATVDVMVEDVGPKRVRFSVRDRGPGIPREKLSKLFGKFQQLDASDSVRKGGTGLGLAISKAIIEQHGGSIGLDSVFGKGTSAWFELDVEAENDVETERALEEIRREYAQGLQAKLAALERAIEALCPKPEDESLLNEVRRQAHSLRGTSGSYGFKEVSEAAGKIEQLVRSDGGVRPTSPVLEALAKALREVVHKVAG